MTDNHNNVDNIKKCIFRKKKERKGGVNVFDILNIFFPAKLLTDTILTTKMFMYCWTSHYLYIYFFSAKCLTYTILTTKMFIYCWTSHYLFC